MTFLAVLIIVSIVSLVLGMVISNRASRPHARESFRRTHRHEPHTHSGRGGWGAGVALLLAVPCALAVMAVFSWMSYDSQQAATVDRGSTEAAFHRVAANEALASDRTPRLPLEEAAVAVTESEAAVPAATAANDSVSGELPDSPAEIGSVAPHDSGADTVTIEPAPAETSSSITHEIHSIPTPGMFGIGLFCLAFLIVAGIWIAHRRQHWSLSGMIRSTVQSLWVVPILASVGWVGYLIWPHLSVEPLVRNTDYNPSRTEFVPYVKLENEEVDESDEYLFTGKNNSPTQEVLTQSELPDWVGQGVQNKGKILHVPVRSGWKLTPSAAKNSARAQAMRVIREDFSRTYPDAEKWRIDAVLEDLNAKVDESTDWKVFTFREEPLYQTHLLVELSDEVRGELVNRWIPELQNFRMGMLLTFGGVLTLVCFAGATCLNLDVRTEGHYRRWLRTATVLAVIAAAAVAHGVLNSLWFPHSL